MPPPAYSCTKAGVSGFFVAPLGGRVSRDAQDAHHPAAPPKRQTHKRAGSNHASMYPMMPQVLLALLLVLPFSEGHAVADDWRYYQNARFQYTICYPHDLLTPLGESDNGDGQRFVGRTGATLAVWGGYNALDQTIDQIETNTVNRLTGYSGTVAYLLREPTWSVVSGVTKDKTSGITSDIIFYRKTFLVGDVQQSFEFTYPRENPDV